MELDRYVAEHVTQQENDSLGRATESWVNQALPDATLQLPAKNITATSLQQARFLMKDHPSRVVLQFNASQLEIKGKLFSINLNK